MTHVFASMATVGMDHLRWLARYRRADTPQEHRGPQEMVLVPMAIDVIADSAPGDPDDPYGWPAVLYAEADHLIDVYCGMGGKL